MRVNFFKYVSLTAAFLATTTCFAMDPPLDEEKVTQNTRSHTEPRNPLVNINDFSFLNENNRQRLSEALSFLDKSKENLSNTLVTLDIQHNPQQANNQFEEEFRKQLDLYDDIENPIDYNDLLCTHIKGRPCNIQNLSSILQYLFEKFPEQLVPFENKFDSYWGANSLTTEQLNTLRFSYLNALQNNRQKGITPPLTLETLDGLSARYLAISQGNTTSEPDKKNYLKEAVWYSILGAKGGDDSCFFRLLHIVNGKFSNKKQYRRLYTYLAPQLSLKDPNAQKLFNRVCAESKGALDWVKAFVKTLKSKEDKPVLSACLGQAICNYYEYEFRSAMDLLDNNPHDAIPRFYELELHNPLAKEELKKWRTTKGYKNPKNALSDDDCGALLKNHELIIASPRYMAYCVFMTSHIHNSMTKDISDIDVAVEHLHFAANLGHQEATIDEKKLKKSKGYQDAKKGIEVKNAVNVAYVLGQRYWIYEQKLLKQSQIEQQDAKEVSLPVESITPPVETDKPVKEQITPYASYKPHNPKINEIGNLDNLQDKLNQALHLIVSNESMDLNLLRELENIYDQTEKEKLAELRDSESYKNAASSNDPVIRSLKDLDEIYGQASYRIYESRMSQKLSPKVMQTAVENLYLAVHYRYPQAIIAKQKITQMKAYKNALKIASPLKEPIYELARNYRLYEQEQLAKTQPGQSKEQSPYVKEISQPVQSITPVQETTSVNKEEQHKKNKQTSKKKQTPKRKGKASKVTQKKKDQGPRLPQDNILETHNQGREEPIAALNSLMPDVMKDIDSAYAALTLIVPVDADGKPTTSIPLPQTNEQKEPQLKDKKEEVAITTEVPVFDKVPDVAAVQDISETPFSKTAEKGPEANKSEKELKVKKPQKTLALDLKEKGKNLLKSAKVAKTIAFSKDPQAKAKKKFLNAAQSTMKTIEQAAPKKELEFSSAISSTTESDDSPKKLKRQNSNKKLERRDYIKMERRASKQKLERRESEKKLERLEASQTTRKILITSDQRDLLFWLTMEDAVVVTNKATVAEVVHLLDNLGCQIKDLPGGGGHKKAKAPHKGGGSWTIPSNQDQIIRSYRNELRTFILENLKIDPKTVPVSGE